MGPHSNPAGSEANESSRFSDDCVSCGLLCDERAPKRHRSEGAVLRSGRTSGTSASAVQDWFSKHKDCAVTVDQMCKPVRASAPAAWADSTEGRVCLASRNVAQWVRKPSQDHETFQGGWK